MAVKGSDMSLTYSKLDRLANRCAHALAELGVRRGDRVGIWLPKSARGVAVMQAVLRLCAIYVPLDPLSPTTRIRTILQDCGLRALVTTQKRAQAVLIDDLQQVACLCVDGSGPGMPWGDLLAFPETPLREQIVAESDVAYILYTSGSTGTPKGACISNRNALAFVEWAAQTLQATSADRFANHAPFHFDLSVLDLYVAFHVGATTYLIPDEMSSMPQPLVNFLLQNAITVWYSVPSVLTLMMEQAGLLDIPISSLRLRTLLFAGEPFPLKHMRRLYEHFNRDMRFFNLYGPTETNVCTSYEVTHIPESWKKPVPIGKACSGDRVWAQKEDSTEVLQPGEIGELMVAGPTVMVGYWGKPAQGDKPYATGDLVQLLADGNYAYIGRRDQQVKIRGYRVEPGDIEVALQEHPAIHEAAVTVLGTGLQARLVAFVVPATDDKGQQQAMPSLLEIKRQCAERLPRYMIVDDVCTLPTLPRTRNGKIDRLALAQERTVKTGEEDAENSRY
jgi:amino acid adenylation domain-containing protein